MKTPKFRIGFEMECCIHADVYQQFQDACYKLWPMLQFGDDQSIEVPQVRERYFNYVDNYNFNTAEIRSEPLDWNVGLKKFEQFLAFLYPFSESGLFVTNSSCGLHVNTSERSIHDNVEPHSWGLETPYSLRADRYYMHVVRHFDESRVLRMFGRSRNEFCHSVLKPRERRSFTYAMIRNKCETEDLLDEKYLACANRDSRRIEFRALGNKKYEQKWPQLNESLELIHHALHTAFEDMQNEEEVSEPVAA